MTLIGGDAALEDKKVLVLEAGPQVKLNKLPELYSNRVSTVSSGSKKLLESKFYAFLNEENCIFHAWFIIFGQFYFRCWSMETY